MKPESQTHGELARPAAQPAIVAAPPPTVRLVPAPRAAAMAPAPAATMSPLGLLRSLRRRAALALGVAILAAGIAGPAAWSLIPLTFKAQARLQVAAQPPKVLFQTVETQTSGGDDYKRYQSTQQTLVKSQLVLNAALQQPKVGGYQMVREQVDPIEWLQEKLKVEFIAGSEVMEISMSGNNAEEVAGIVNAVKKAYMEEVVNVDAKRRSDRHDNLKKIKERYAENLKQRRDTLRKLAETVGSDDRDTLALRQQYAMEHLAHLQKEMLEVQSQKRRAEARLKMRPRPEESDGGAAAPAITAADVDAMVDREPSVAELLAKLDQQEEQWNRERAHIERVSRNASADPVLQSLRDDIKGTKKLLARRRAAVRPAAVRLLQQRGAQDQVAQNDELDQERAMLDDIEARLKEEIKSINVVNQSLTVNTLDLQAIQDDVAQIEGAAVKVATEVEAINVELSAPPRIRVVDDAVVPRVRDDKKRLMMVGMVTAGSFFAGLFGIAFLELMNRKVDTAEEVPLELGLMVVGALPILPSRAHHGGGIARRETDRDRYWRNLLLESVDATRTMLVHAARTGSHRVVMITSAVGGEGKTSLASYLATSLARSGLRTLLVDADLRSPSIHRLFDLPPGPGLSELVRGELALDDAIASTSVEDLRVLTGGRCDRQTLRVLAQGVLSPLFDQLKERFDFVIVDSSPVLPVADALLVAQEADAVLFSIFQEVSSKTKVAAAFQRLQRLGVPVLGAVVTGGQGGMYGNGYYGSDSSYPGLPDSVAVSSSEVS